MFNTIIYDEDAFVAVELNVFVQAVQTEDESLQVKNENNNELPPQFP